jgi:transporter family-2 protein
MHSGIRWKSVARQPGIVSAGGRAACGAADVLASSITDEKGLAEMPWWAPLGGLIGAFAVITGLLFVGKVGAGAAGLTITANILMSLVIDKYGMFGMDVHELSPGRIIGAILMVAGIALISKF